ncbi:MAG TPA: hypothetical protein VGT04_00865 [Acidobacteriaceae bacterium]|nr:hypothetical protein [Acidobacteriaceae bacterium]
MNSSPAPLCTHTKMNGTRCGSPAVKGTELCFHHSAVKSALGKARPSSEPGEYSPLPFVFPEDRESVQINYFLLLRAMSEQRIEPRMAQMMFRLLHAMAVNMGKMAREQAKDGEAASGADATPMERPQPKSKHEEPFVSAFAQAAAARPAAMEKRSEKLSFDIAASAFQKNPTPGYLSMQEVVATLSAMKGEYPPSSLDFI